MNTPQVDALMAKWDDDGATRGSAFCELRDLARVLEEKRAALTSAQLLDIAKRCGIKAPDAALVEFAALVREAEPVELDEVQPVPSKERCRNTMIEKAEGAIPKSCPRCGLNKYCADTSLPQLTGDETQDRRPCRVAPSGWYCTRGIDHEGPCAAEPVLWDHKPEEVLSVEEVARFFGVESHPPGSQVDPSMALPHVTAQLTNAIDHARMQMDRQQRHEFRQAFSNVLAPLACAEESNGNVHWVQVLNALVDEAMGVLKQQQPKEQKS